MKAMGKDWYQKNWTLDIQNMFMRTTIKADDGRNIPIMTMGPIYFLTALCHIKL